MSIFALKCPFEKGRHNKHWWKFSCRKKKSGKTEFEKSGSRRNVDAAEPSDCYDRTREKAMEKNQSIAKWAMLRCWILNRYFTTLLLKSKSPLIFWPRKQTARRQSKTEMGKVKQEKKKRTSCTKTNNKTRISTYLRPFWSIILRLYVYNSEYKDLDQCESTNQSTESINQSTNWR